MDALTRIRVGAELERHRTTADHFADQLVKWHVRHCNGMAHVTRRNAATPRDWFATLGSSHDCRPVRAFLRAEGEEDDLDRVIDIEKVRHAQAFFETYGLHIAAGLLLKSLPDAYACARGAQVLYLTGELVSDPARRVRETAQMLILVVSPDLAIDEKKRRTTTTLHAGRAGATAARRIRLFHALVRHLFEQDEHLSDRWRKRAENFGRHGRPALGDPICQEDQLGTLLTFTVSVFEALERLGVPFDDDDRDAWFHVWDVIGRHLGVGVSSALGVGESHVHRPAKDEVFAAPLTPDVSDEFMTVIRERHHEACHEGKILANALLQEVQGPLPRAFKPLPASLLQYLAGPHVQQILGVRSGGWFQYWANRVTSGRRLSRVALSRPTRLPGGELSAVMSREVLQMFTEQGNLDIFRDGPPRGFDLPDRLRRSWGVHRQATHERPPGAGLA